MGSMIMASFAKNLGMKLQGGFEFNTENEAKPSQQINGQKSLADLLWGWEWKTLGFFSASLTPEPRQIYQNLASNLDNFKSCWILTDHPLKDQGLVPLIILPSEDWTLIVYWPLRVWFPMKLKVLGVWGNKTVAIILPTSIWTRFRLSIP